MYTILDRATGQVLYTGAKLELAQALLLKYGKRGYNCLLFKSGKVVG